ncbi:DNA polymerase III subunit delta' [Clostridium sediminicola]|uniref:DNA polymerase III subunit delta' n=1 Tax=Clostridium sediminicola TaxID=3114879 RepID=UPI0031F21E73
MGFETIIGHNFIKNQIQNSILKNTLSHAHLIVGENGIGKSLIAYQMAIQILGKKENKYYVDIVEWKIKKNKMSIGVNDIRSLIVEVNKKPYEGNKKVIIIYHAHKMTTEAQNAILKTIEEPPKGVTLILLTENLELLLDTIKSRSQVHRLNRLTNIEIKTYLNQKYPDLSHEEINLLINFSEGIPGRCDLYLNDEAFKEIRSFTLILLKDTNNKSDNIIPKYEELFNRYKTMWEEILNSLLVYIRDMLIYKETGNDKLIINFDKFDDLKEISNIYSYKNLEKLVSIINKSREKLENKVNYELVFNVMLLKMQEV